MHTSFLTPCLFALLATIGPAGTAHAHADASGHGPRTVPSPDTYPWGRAGAPGPAVRVIRVDMHDTMRFKPASLRVRQGETVRFVVRNRGAVLHEMVIGTGEALASHAELMRKHPGMEHDEPYMAHVAPGRRGEIVWTFSEPGRFWYGCLVPGHWEAGMKGRIVVVPR